MHPVLFLLSCNPQSEPTDSADTDTSAESEVVLEPVWSADEMVAQLDEFLADGIPSPRQMQDTFSAFFAHGDATCPGSGTWMAEETKLGCYAESGWMYSGIGGIWEKLAEYDNSSTELIIQIGDLEILGTEKQRLAIGGHWLHDIRFLEDRVEWSGDISGTWTADGVDFPWLDETTSAWLDYYGVRYNTDELLISAFLQGGLSIGERAVHFDELLFNELDCESVEQLNPSGTISMLDPSGGWYRLVLDADCDPCGQLSFNGVVVEEERCVELFALRQTISERLSW